DGSIDGRRHVQYRSVPRQARYESRAGSAGTRRDSRYQGSKGAQFCCMVIIVRDRFRLRLALRLVVAPLGHASTAVARTRAPRDKDESSVLAHRNRANWPLLRCSRRSDESDKENGAQIPHWCLPLAAWILTVCHQIQDRLSWTASDMSASSQDRQH